MFKYIQILLIEKDCGASDNNIWNFKFVGRNEIIQ